MRGSELWAPHQQREAARVLFIMQSESEERPKCRCQGPLDGS
jgi:hypothetical protein